MNIVSIQWATLNNLWYFGIVLFIIILLCFRFIKQKKSQELLALYHTRFLLNTSAFKQWLKIGLFTTACLFLCIALLRPQWDKSEEIITQEGRDLYIALDISRSMLATDCVPNRLTFAKEKIKHLVKKLSCERIGLILFSGSAFVQCPLTSDYNAFYLYLDAVDVESISSGSTALDRAIQQAMKSFMCIPERKSKLLTIFTDGEDFSQNLVSTQKEAIEQGISIFTIGVGTPEGAPIPLLNEQAVLIGHQKDKKGNIVISRLNENTLQSLCYNAGGMYLRATNDNSDIHSFVHAIQSFEKEKISEQHISQHEDQYHYFLLVSFICFAFEWLL